MVGSFLDISIAFDRFDYYQILVLFEVFSFDVVLVSFMLDVSIPTGIFPLITMPVIISVSHLSQTLNYLLALALLL